MMAFWIIALIISFIGAVADDNNYVKGICTIIVVFALIALMKLTF